jgi:hypothetical protein
LSGAILQAPDVSSGLFSPPVGALLCRLESQAPMITRSHSNAVVFSHPFELKGIDGVLPPGEYRVVTDEELIEELSFPVYRRVATMIFVPARKSSAVEMIAVDPLDLQAAQERDGATTGRFAKEAHR